MCRAQGCRAQAESHVAVVAVSHERVGKPKRGKMGLGAKQREAVPEGASLQFSKMDLGPVCDQAGPRV